MTKVTPRRNGDTVWVLGLTCMRTEEAQPCTCSKSNPAPIWILQNHLIGKSGVNGHMRTEVRTSQPSKGLPGQALHRGQKATPCRMGPSVQQASIVSSRPRPPQYVHSGWTCRGGGVNRLGYGQTHVFFGRRLNIESTWLLVFRMRSCLFWDRSSDLP